jgi:predicted transcriptional regulator
MDSQSSQQDPEKIVLEYHELDLLQEGGFQVLTALMSNPTTTRQLAIRLNLSRARVQYIVDKLVQRGVVSIHQEVQEAGRGEVYYTAAAKDVLLALNKDAPQQSQIAVGQIILNSLQTNMPRALVQATSQTKMALRLVQCRIDEGNAQAFITRINELVREFSDAEVETAAHEYALALALYPIVDDQQPA